jgi:hypothetical protein
LQLGDEVSLPVRAGWSELLFSPGGNCIALQVQLCLVSSSPSKVGQFSFEHCLLSLEISSGIHHLPCFGRLACHPTPTLSFYTSPDFCLVLVAPLGGWLFTSSLLSAFVTFPEFNEFIQFSTESSAPCPIPVLLGRFSVPPPPLLFMLQIHPSSFGTG